ncbi:MAG TPA: hypothetical protein VG102_02765 [Candidatus Paceibacterota bacterium]|nr:hypothetical protein [Candidatus Paceibacterota bacterium]
MPTQPALGYTRGEKTSFLFIGACPQRDTAERIVTLRTESKTTLSEREQRIFSEGKCVLAAFRSDDVHAAMQRNEVVVEVVGYPYGGLSFNAAKMTHQSGPQPKPIRLYFSVPLLVHKTTDTTGWPSGIKTEALPDEE